MSFAPASYGTRDIAYESLGLPDFESVAHISKPYSKTGAQWLSGRVFDSRPRGRGLEPHRRHCVVVLEQNAFILA